MVQNVWYLNGQPSHVTLPFEYWTPILSIIQINLVFRCSVFRWLLYQPFYHLNTRLVCNSDPHLQRELFVPISHQVNLVPKSLSFSPNKYALKRQQDITTSNDIIAGNGRVLNFYLFIVWLYLFKKIYNVNNFFFFFPSDAMLCFN